VVGRDGQTVIRMEDVRVFRARKSLASVFGASASDGAPSNRPCVGALPGDRMAWPGYGDATTRSDDVYIQALAAVPAAAFLAEKLCVVSTAHA
jgi:hypothetical protein